MQQIAAYSPDKEKGMSSQRLLVERREEDARIGFSIDVPSAVITNTVAHRQLIGLQAHFRGQNFAVTVL